VSSLPVSTRPLGITALGAFFVFGTLASGLSAVSLLFPDGPLEPMWRLNPRAHEAFSHMGLWAPLLLGAVCLACAAAAFGFFTGRRWGYWLGVALLLLNLTGDLINTVLSIEPRAVVGVPIVALILWYLSRQRVRAFFKSAARGAA
jgi:ABC-type branched-subunit amino acid transport system permease subunit